MERLLLVAVIDGELVLVEAIDDVLVDRATGRVLDPTEVEVHGIAVPEEAARS